MLLRDHEPQDQLGQFLLGAGRIGGPLSKISATEEQSIATGDADVVFFLDDSDKITSTRTQTFRGFMSLVDTKTIQETVERTQYSFMALLSTDLLKRTEEIDIDRLISANATFPGMIEKQSGLIHVSVRRFFGQPTIINFRRNTFVSETRNSVMPFIVLTPESSPIGAGTATTNWTAGTFNIEISKNLDAYRNTLTYLGYVNTPTG